MCTTARGPASRGQACLSTECVPQLLLMCNLGACESTTPFILLQPCPPCAPKARLQCSSLAAASPSAWVKGRSLHCQQPTPHLCSPSAQPETPWVTNTDLRCFDPVPTHIHWALGSPCVTDIGLHCPKPASVEEDGRRLPLSAAQKSGRGGLATDQTILASSMGSSAGSKARTSRAEGHLAWRAQVHGTTGSSACSTGGASPTQAGRQTGTVAAVLKQS